MQKVHAHQLRPSIVNVEFTQNGKVNLKIETNIERILAGIGVTHEDTDDAPEAERYNQLRKLSAHDLKAEFLKQSDGWLQNLSLKFDDSLVALKLVSLDIPEVGDIERSRLSNVYLSTEIPSLSKRVTWHYPEQYGNNVVHFYYANAKKNKTSHWLTKNAQSPEFILNATYVSKPFLQVAWEYTELGYEHIVPKGLDHILFVLGLFLLSARLRPLLWQVTAFTVAHSITLGLTIYGVLSLPSSIVEPLIALSIMYVGLENIWVKELKPWRIALVFLFGLLHGMGFAGVLSELGLPESDFLTALLFFNVGVEAGQLSVILGSFILVFWLLKDERRYRQWVIVPFSIMIALMGGYWLIERLFW